MSDLKIDRVGRQSGKRLLLMQVDPKKEDPSQKNPGAKESDLLCIFVHVSDDGPALKGLEQTKAEDESQPFLVIFVDKLFKIESVEEARKVILEPLRKSKEVYVILLEAFAENGVVSERAAQLFGFLTAIPKDFVSPDKFLLATYEENPTKGDFVKNALVSTTKNLSCDKEPVKIFPDYIKENSQTSIFDLIILISAHKSENSGDGVMVSQGGYFSTHG